jgi:hypothetical protein
MAAYKRLLLALGCTVLGVSTVGLLGVLRTLPYGLRYVGPNLEMLPVYLIVALAGWVIAIPFVFAFKSARGTQGWLTLCIGTVIGPAFLTACLRGQINWVADGFALVLSAVIGFLTTIFYLLLLRTLTH